MAFPGADRLRTYVDGVTSIPAADMNTLQDVINTIWSRVNPGIQRTRIVNPESSLRLTGWTIASAFPYADLAASTTGILYVPLPVEVGDRIVSVTVLAASFGGVVTDVNASLRRLNQASGAGAPGTETTIVTSTNLPAAVFTTQKIVLTPAGGQLVSADTSYYVRVNGAATAGGKVMLRTEYLYERPLVPLVL